MLGREAVAACPCSRICRFWAGCSGSTRTRSTSRISSSSSPRGSKAMTPVFHRIERVLGMLLLAVATSSCMDQGDLFGPDPEAGSPRIRLGAAGYDLHSGEHVDVSVANLGARDGMVELLVLDASREVVWRSTRVVVDDTIVDVPVTSIPAEMVGSSALSLTASLESDGVRGYASDDTAA